MTKAERTVGDTMKRILILGAAGSLARVATKQFLDTTDAQLTLYLRKAHRLSALESSRVRVVEGDVLDEKALTQAMAGQDVVYANLAGQMEQQARTIVKAMTAAGVKRLIFISSMGIYNEVPGESHGSVLDPYRKSAAVIEASDLDYTILRPAWFTNDDEIDYETTEKGQPFKGSAVSRKSIADVIIKLALSPNMAVRGSLGISKP
jgi:uncharacterized protein YbjT (DUF2867 family)